MTSASVRAAGWTAVILGSLWLMGSSDGRIRLWFELLRAGEGPAAGQFFVQVVLRDLWMPLLAVVAGLVMLPVSGRMSDEEHRRARRRDRDRAKQQERDRQREERDQRRRAEARRKAAERAADPCEPTAADPQGRPPPGRWQVTGGPPTGDGATAEVYAHLREFGPASSQVVAADLDLPLAAVTAALRQLLGEGRVDTLP